jgi:acyl carrier protein
MRSLRERVVDTVAGTLRIDARVVAATPTLFDLAGFDSLAIVAILERLEDDLGIEVPPERILPETFASIDALCDLIAGADPGVRR